MTSFICKESTRIPEIGNILVYIIANIWRLEEVMDITFGSYVSNKVLHYATKSHGYSFYPF